MRQSESRVCAGACADAAGVVADDNVAGAPSLTWLLSIGICYLHGVFVRALIEVHVCVLFTSIRYLHMPLGIRHTHI